MLLQIQEPDPLEHSNPIHAVGIDLGTTHSLVAYVGPKGPELLPLGPKQQVLFPSVVSFDPAGNVRVGPEALATNNPQWSLLRSVKRLMGRTTKDIAAQQFPYALQDDPEQGLRICLPHGTVSPEDVACLILERLKQETKQALGYEVNKAVITVPAYFDEAARQATRRAAQKAGWDVLRLVAEPTAAALAYGLGQGTDALYGVYDLGGGTFDFSLLQLRQGVFRVLATGGDLVLGGDDLDMSICTHFGLSASVQLLEDIRAIKERVCTQLVPEEFKIQGTSYLVTPELCAMLSEPLIERTLKIVKSVLKDSAVNPKSVHQMILVGGASRLPWLKQHIEMILSWPCSLHHPDTVVALGAALQAGALTYGAQHLLLDVTPLSLGIEILGGRVDVIIPRNSPLPAQVEQTFTTGVNNQRNLKLHIVQGESLRVQDCRSLGVFELNDLPLMPAGQPRICVTFTVDTDGLLHVSAKELITGVAQSMDISPTHGLDTDTIAQLLG